VDELIQALRAERPQPRPEFTATLDERAAEGFPRGGAGGDLDRMRQAARRIPSEWPRLVPALGAAAAVVVGIGIAISQPGLGGSDGGSLGGGGGKPPMAVERGSRGDTAAKSIAPTSAPEALSTVPGPPPEALKTRARKVERSAQLTLATSAGDVENVADDVFGVVDQHRGIVQSSSVTGGDAGAAGAQFALLIPGAELQATVADLSKLAHVRSRTEGSLDVTGPFVTARERLADARAERERLLRRLESATSSTQAEAIRAQVRTVDERLASARREVGSISRRVRFSHLQLSVVGDGTAPASDWGLDDAWHDAVDVLAVLLGAALVGLAALLPIALLAAVTWLAYAALRRRGRERALDRR
jgi:hypothetical protein